MEYDVVSGAGVKLVGNCDGVGVGCGECGVDHSDMDWSLGIRHVQCAACRGGLCYDDHEVSGGGRGLTVGFWGEVGCVGCEDEV